MQPVPPPVRVALALLACVAGVFLAKALPPLAPENLFVKTQSRLQAPVDVLFNRVAALRPGNALTPVDQVLRGKFVNLESKLLYLQFGPDVLASCPFCSADEPKSYFYYALPSILWPHVFNLIVISIVTSPTLTNRYGGQWRTVATSAAAVLVLAEAYLVSNYNHQANARALRLDDLDFFHWSMRSYRLLGLAVLDGLLGTALYLSSTNRAFVQLPSPAERVEMVNRATLSVRSKLSALGIVKNTALRDDDLRARSQAYWSHEVRLMREVMEEREVIEGINDALSNRVNVQNIQRDADAYTQSLLQPLQESSPEGSM